MSMQWILPNYPLFLYYNKTEVCRGISIFFLFLLQNIDCRYRLDEAGLTSKIKKNPINCMGMFSNI